MRESVVLEVVVRVPQGLLWSGRLLVDGARGASWRQSQSEAVSPSCEQIDQPFGASQREASVTLRRVMRSDVANDLFFGRCALDPPERYGLRRDQHG